jgi:hypothetical protein
MGFLRWLTSAGLEKKAGEDYPLPVNQAGYDSTIDDITIHHARGTAVHAIEDVSTNTTTAEIACPAWANAVIMQTSVTEYAGAGVTFYCQGSQDGTNFGVLYDVNQQHVSTHAANGIMVHTFKGLPQPADGSTSIKFSVSTTDWDNAGTPTVANLWYQFASV